MPEETQTVVNGDILPEIKPLMNIKNYGVPTEVIKENIEHFKTRFTDEQCPRRTLAPIVRDHYHIDLSITKDVWNDEFTERKEVVSRYTLTSEAEDQYLSKLGIPRKVYDKCTSELKQQLLTHFHSLLKNRRYLLRIRDNQFIRGVLDQEFPTNLDNDVIFPSILDKVDELKGNIGHYTHCPDDFIHIEIWFPDSVVNYEGYTITGGVSITNSEVGQSCLWFDPIIKVESSGINSPTYPVYSARIESNGSKAGSIGFVHKKSWQRISADEITQAFNLTRQASQVGIIQYMEAMGKRVNTKAALAELEKVKSIPKRLLKMVEEEVRNEENIEQAALINKVLLAAKDLPILQRAAVQQGCSHYLGVFNNVQSRMEKLSLEINGDEEK